MAPKKKEQKKDEEEKQIYKGVYKNQGYWRSRVWDTDREVYLGHFKDEISAAIAYDKAKIRRKNPVIAAAEGLNFDLKKYELDIPRIMQMSMDDLVFELRESGVKTTGDLKLI
eukprot:TRINITY_DN7474_c0_g1_i1.p2 TRINITY_DN7474_c0_g1~~TRINITY_DN7474_c0_g1_i1.p2  ORF type:complete len:113 (-),score=28.38 TRINITY_DN7474_c0_g1_i1:546-884(-)